MAETQRTLTLAIKADIEAARQQLDALVGVMGKSATQVDERLNRIEASFDRANRSIGSKSLALATTIGSAFGSVLGNLISQIPSALQQIATSAVDSASSIKNTSESLGISTNALQDFRIGASKAGVEVGKADKALESFQKTSGRAAQGNREALAAFKAIGVEIADGSGNLKPYEQLVREVADGLAKLPDPARQSAAAVKLFGENGNDLLPFLTTGSQGMNDLAAASEALGLKLSPETINRLDEMGNKAEAIKKVINAQLATAIGENADAFLALGAGAQAAIEGMAGLLRQMQGIKLLMNRGDAVSLFGMSGEELAALGTAKGRANYADAKVAEFAGKGYAPGSETMRDAESFQASARQDLFNEKFPIKGRPAAAPAGGRVVAPPPKAVPKGRAARAGFDLRGGIDGVLAEPGVGISALGSNDEAAKALAQLDGSARTLRDTLREAFDPGPVGDLVQALPDLTSQFDEVHLVSQQIVADLAGGIAGIITQSGSLGDKLISVFARIGESMLQSGILNFLSGGEQGTSFGTLFKSVSSLFGGARADGGPVTAGKAYLVGERGPEIMMAGMSGTIIPNHALRGATGGSGGGGVTQNFDLRGALVTEDVLARIDATGQRAAQTGALGGRQLAAQDIARKRRRSMI